MDHIVTNTAQLFQFNIGDSDVGEHLMCNGDVEIFHEGKKYTPYAVKASGREDSAERRRSEELEISMEQTCPVAKILRGYPPSFRVSLTVWEHNDTEYAPAWRGEVYNYRFEDGEGVITCREQGTAADKAGLLRRFQASCPFQLYGKACGATRVHETLAVLSTSPFVVSGSIGSPGNPTLSGYPTSGGIDNPYPGGHYGGISAGLGSWTTDAAGQGTVEVPVSAYSGGVLTWTNLEGMEESRAILQLVENGDGEYGVRVAGPPPEVGVLSCTVLRSCRRTEETCADWHDNAPNFGGCIGIPQSNPVQNYREFF